MAEKEEVGEKVELKEATKTAKKKIATGNTKKIVQKRSSSAAGKAVTKKGDNTKTSNKNNAIPKTTNKAEIGKNSKKTDDKAKNVIKVDTKGALEEQEVEKEEKKEDKKKEVSSEKKEENVKHGSKKNTKKVNVKNDKAEAKDENIKTTKENRKEVKKKEKDKKETKNNAEISNKEKKSKTQLQEQKDTEIEEAVKKEIKANKKIPRVELRKINARVFQNIFLAIVVMFYLNFVILGFINIESFVFITDLKVFSMAILVVSIGIFEYAYKKDSGRHTIHGIEILVLAFITMALIYVDLMWANKFIYIVAFVTYVFAIYYVAKSIIIYNRMKKEYFVGKMKEIIKK